MKKRNAIPEKYKWQPQVILGGSEDNWQVIHDSVKEMLPQIKEYKGKLGDKKSMLEFLKKSQDIEDELMKIYAYAKIKLDEDLKDSKYSSMVQKAEALFVVFSANSSYSTPEIIELDSKILDSYISDKDFSDYDYMFKRLRDKKEHILSEKEEKLLSEFGDLHGGYSEVFDMIDDADMKFGDVKVGGKKEKLSHARYSLFMQNEDREVRKKTFETYYQSYKDLIHTISKTYSYSVKEDWFYAKVRKYKSCLEKALAGEDVSSNVYENLLESVGENICNLNDYISFKKKMLKLDKFHMYDMYMPIIEGQNLRMDYDKAYKTVIEALSVLGEDYVEVLNEAFSGGWIDVYESSGKASGAYSFGVRTAHPFVLLNYEETTHDVFTIAHEMGHAMHSYYSNKKQVPAKASYKIFVAEVASTVNEVLLLKHVIGKTEDVELKKYLMYYLLEMFRTTMFRQTQFAEFEYISHKMTEEGVPLTNENLSEVYEGLNSKYYGKDLESDDCIKYEWARIPHFYRAFYVYKYATGIITAVSLAQGILSGDKSKVKKYREFLESGGSKSPVELLKDAGVDLTTKKPFEEAMNLFGETLKELKKLCGVE